MLSRVLVETCRIRFFNLLNWVLFNVFVLLSIYSVLGIFSLIVSSIFVDRFMLSCRLWACTWTHRFRQPCATFCTLSFLSLSISLSFESNREQFNVCFFSLAQAFNVWNAMLTKQAVNQQTRKISVSAFWLAVFVYTWAKVNNVKVTFISIFWINFS